MHEPLVSKHKKLLNTFKKSYTDPKMLNCTLLHFLMFIYLLFWFCHQLNCRYIFFWQN